MELYTMSLVSTDGSESIIYGHATLNVITEYMPAYAENLEEGQAIKINLYVAPLANWEENLLAGRY